MTASPGWFFGGRFQVKRPNGLKGESQMNHVSATLRAAVAFVLATSAVCADESRPANGGTTTTTVTESGSSGGRTYRRQTTITRSSSSSRSRSSAAGKKPTSVKRKAPFKPGDDVLTEHGGEIYEGKVESVDRSSGWIDVRYEDEDGSQKTHKVPPTHLTRAYRNGKKLLTADPGQKGEFAVGDEVLAAFGGVHLAEVVEIAGTGWVTVRFDNDGFEMKPTLPPKKLRLIEREKIPLEEALLVRTWASQGGKFTIQAKFVELRDDSVTLKKEDGKSLTVAIDKLSDDDQELARRLAEAKDHSADRHAGAD